MKAGHSDSLAFGACYVMIVFLLKICKLTLCIEVVNVNIYARHAFVVIVL